MKIVAFVFGIVLTGLGVASYTLAAAPGMAALLPVLFGLLAILFALLQGRWPHNNPLYGTLMMAVLSLLVSLRGVVNLFRLISGSALTMSPEVAWLQSAIAGLGLFYIVVCVAFIPDFWHGWKKFGFFLGDWVARVALTFFYFTVFVPFGIGVRLLADPLHIKSTPEQLWRPRSTGDQKLEEIQRQF